MTSSALPSVRTVAVHASATLPMKRAVFQERRVFLLRIRMAPTRIMEILMIAMAVRYMGLSMVLSPEKRRAKRDTLRRRARETRVAPATARKEGTLG